MAEKSPHKYSYNVTTSYHPGARIVPEFRGEKYPEVEVLRPSVEMNVYRVAEEQDADGNPVLKKTNISRVSADVTERRNDFAGLHGISAVEAHLKAKDFTDQHPDAEPKLKPVVKPNVYPGVMVNNGHIMERDVQSEIAAAEREAHEIEARRNEVALAVAGMDLATADHMAELTVTEQVAAIQE